VPLTEAALSRSRELDEPIAAELTAYLTEHVEEERGHDDELLGDLELLGLDRETVLRRVPSPTIAALVGAQYYWIHHHHPVAFLGFAAFMEGYPPSPELIETLVERTGFPRESFRTLTTHGELDPGHRDHLDETVDSLPLTPDHETVMAISAAATATLAARAVEEVLPSQRPHSGGGRRWPGSIAQ
jgi:Iron-containing redox enzyme